ncbi:MAG TPA: glycosyltransferase [Pyrinomonadaceae bacterium]|nr:glycosyltransferase [Pyrinomonadaceae bacterium]
MLHGKSIICFGGEDWWYHHPHSKNHLMRRFARAGNKVIFVNSISMGLAPMKSGEVLPRVKRKLKSYAKLARTTEEGITVVSPAVLPFFGSRAAAATNQKLLTVQISSLAKRRGLTRPILWIAIPTAVDIVGRLNERLVIYHVSDKYDANTMDHATDPAMIRKFHERAIDAADLIFYSSRKLLAEADRGLEKSHLLEQAVDFDHWSGINENQIAQAVAQIPRPRIGYFGAIEPWLVDQDLIKQAARERPNWNWIFIGNKSRGLEIETLPTVHFLPPVSYQALPGYAAGFDVCVLPWNTEVPFTSYGSAIKVREYLASGKPVVISPLLEYESMSDVLRIARSRDQFIELVDDALQETGADKPQARQNAVRNGTWDVRAEWVSGLIEERLALNQ